MSHEPRRLLNDGGGASTLTSIERSLLLAGQNRARREPDGVRERVWGSIAVGGGIGVGAAAGVAIAPGAGAGTATTAATKGVGVAAAITKAKLLIVTAVVASAATVGSAAVIVSRTADKSDAQAPRGVDKSSVVTPMPSPQKLTAVDAPPASPSATPAVVRPDDLPPASQPPKPAAGRSTPVTVPAVHDAKSGSELPQTQPQTTQPSRESELRAEADLLTAAQADLARGDATSASRRIAESKTRFPNGMLAEEREALEVRAALAAGDQRRASTLARAFLAHHPKSPSRSSIEPIAQLSPSAQPAKKSPTETIE